MSSYSFGSISYDDLTFSNVNVNELDPSSSSNYYSFVSQYPADLSGYVGYSSSSSPYVDGVEWTNFTAGVKGASAAAVSQTLTFTYTVTSAPGSDIWYLNGLVIPNVISAGGSIVATETFVDPTTGNVVATMNYASGTASDIALTQGYASLNVTLTVTASLGANSGPTAKATYSAVQQGFENAGLEIDKQISTDGVTWVDVGTGNTSQNPTVVTGAPIYERVVVTNEGNLAVNGATVSDAGTGGFTFGGSGSINLSGLQTVTSDVVTLTSSAGVESSTATVTGTASNGTAAISLTASDVAGYTAETPSISVDEQVSVDGGTTWYDVGVDTLQAPSATIGAPVIFRSVVTDTSSVGETGVSLSDVSGYDFTFSGSPTTSLTAGQTIVSDQVTVTAVQGYDIDQATVQGTATIGGTPVQVSATDYADYIGEQAVGTISLSPGVTIDDQVSLDGVTWQDVGSDVLDNPTTLDGGPVYFRSIVTDSGTASETVSLTDTDGETLATTSLTAGQSVTSSVVTIAAADGHNFDTASVVGTAAQGAPVAAGDTADYTGVSAGITIDDQVSLDGVSWQDVGPNTFDNPTTLDGGPVYFRSIVTDNGTSPESGVSLTDSDGETLATTNLTAGQSVTSSVVTIAAADGHNFDTASVSGTASAGGQTSVVAAGDTADYTGVSAGITIDDQVSLDGVSWQDVGPNTFDNPTTLDGGPVYFRSIVTDSGTSLESGVLLTDSDGETLATTNLTAGQSVTSSVVTIAAADGHNFDTASVSGTASAGGQTSVVAAGDTADYTGVSAGISIDDQVSLNGTTWQDVGSGVLNNPTTLDGGPVYFRSIVTDSGTSAESGVALTDSDGETLGTNSLTAGQSVTSSVVTIAAADGHNFDTASVSGTASAGGQTSVVAAGDTADYTGASAGISIDDQVSLNGTTWQDVGSDVLNNPTTLDGGPVYFRSIVTDSGTGAESGVLLTDSDGETLATTNLTAGQSVTSSVVTIAAADGHNFDTASVSGTASAGGQTSVVAAGDTADYTGVSAGISIDDQVSLNGTTWQDVGSGVLNNPTTLDGGPVYFRSIVTDSGTTSETGVALTDSHGETLGTTSLTAGQSVTSSVVTLTAAAGHNLDTASVSGTATVTGGSSVVSAGDTADYTGVSAGITIDDQVSFNGTTWYDVGSGVLTNPTTLVGAPVYFRSIVTDSGTTSETGVALTDSHGETLGTTSLTAGQSVTSSVVTLTAAAGHNLDTASVSGTATVTGGSSVVSAGDTADYTGVSAGITIDDQVSFNGTTWYDVGSGVLTNPTTLVGAPVYFRSIVTDSGTTSETGVALADSHGETLGTTSLTAGQSVTSSVVTLTAAAGHNLDTASVSGTATVSTGSMVVSANDTADYTGVAATITIDDQVSLNGTTWYDVGVGNLTGPTTTPGTPVYFRSIVTDTSSVSETGVKLTDTDGEKLSVTSLTAGQSVTSSVVTVTAAAGHNYDTAGVVGTATTTGGSVTVSASDTADYNTAAIVVTKVADCTTAAAGAPVTYTITVTNTGDTAVSGLKLVDNDSTTATTADDVTPTYVSGDTNKNGILDAGESWTYTETTAPPTRDYTFSGSESSASGGGGCGGGGGGCGSSSNNGCGGTGSTLQGGVTVTLVNGELIITVTNNTTSPTDFEQVITGLTLTIDGSVGKTSLASSSGSLVDVSSSHNAVTETGVSGSITDWSATGSQGTITLTDSNGNSTGDGIIGTGSVSGADSTLTGSSTNPYALGTVTFVVDAANITTASEITGVSLTYGDSSSGSDCGSSGCGGNSGCGGGGSSSDQTTLTGTSTAVAETNTVTATGLAGSTTVTGSASATVTVGGTAPGGNVCGDFSGKPTELQFQWNGGGGGNCVSTLDENKIAGCTGNNAPSSACFIVVTDKAGDYASGATSYYQGSVSSGQTFCADAQGTSTGSFESGSGCDLYVHVFASQAAYNAHQAATQDISYNASGSCGIALGDQLGGCQIVGYVSSTNQGYLK